MEKNSSVHIDVRGLSLNYGERQIQRDLTFSIQRGDIFIIMGDSGSGKSTLMRHLIGLTAPSRGEILIDGKNIWTMQVQEREALRRRIGVTYQSGALWSSMTVGENVALPLQEFSSYDRNSIIDLVSLKLSLVGLNGFQGYYPSELSGGMQKRAGLARAIALDPEILFFDEPSAGLDPITSKKLDKLIQEIRDNLGTTVVIITHELSTILGIGDNSIFLDSDSKTIIARGRPVDLLKDSNSEKVREFFGSEFYTRELL